MSNYTKKYQKFIEMLLLPGILLVYPFLSLKQGADVSDAMYSLANFEFFPEMKGTWMVATFLSNVAGNLLMKLPFGETVIGIRFYTTMFPVLAALTVYYVLRKRVGAPPVFIGEILALSLCWCPTTILYNYLTYLLMTFAVLFLFLAFAKNCEKSVCGEKFTRQQLYFLAAGICLGLNIAVRMPNVTEASFIVAVWYGMLLTNKKAWSEICKATLWCLTGYITGFAIPLLAICVRFGAEAYPQMLVTMFAMTENAVDYKPTSMLTGMFGDYRRALLYLSAAVAVMFVATLLSVSASKTGNRKKALLVFDGRVITTRHIRCLLFDAGYALVYFLLLRFYWGRGLFTFHYYEYRSMYYPAVFFLVMTIGMALYAVFSKKECKEIKILAVIILIQILITPLGSNNVLYPIINNLFVAAPFCLIMVGRILPRKLLSVPCVILTSFVLIQGVCFHTQYAFQDGVNGEEREVTLSGVPKAEGLVTHRENADTLTELAGYVQKERLTGREVILYGDISGVAYLFDMPSALSTFWPSLASYRVTEFEEDMYGVRKSVEAGGSCPIIIADAYYAAYINNDEESMLLMNADEEQLRQDEKLNGICEWMRLQGYERTFENAKYTVYSVKD